MADLNLTQADADALLAMEKRRADDADALASRLLRIREGMIDSHLSVVVGYMASPGGLNGEADMRDWILEKVTPDVYDLSSESEQFKQAAEAGLQAAGVAV